MIEAVVAGALSLLGVVILLKRVKQHPWSFLSRWKLSSGERQKKRHLPLGKPLKGENPMADHHLQAFCGDTFKGIQDPDYSREPAGAFVHLESILNRIQSRFLPQSGFSNGLLGDTLIDQKAFMDCFRSEKDVIVALYQCNEERMIFVSANVKKLLGYSPGDFRIRFHDILHDYASWKDLLMQLRSRHKTYAPLALHRLAEGASNTLSAWDVYLGYVQRGRDHYAVVLFYPAFCLIKRS